jgi:ABC-type sulfate/molybdate transport systems ATPase subunit
VLVTHDPFEATELCTMGVLLEGGRATERGKLVDLVRESSSGILSSFRQRIGGWAGALT